MKHFDANYFPNAVRSKLWPVQERLMVKGTLGVCVVYKKIHGVPLEHVIADLPASRVEACGTSETAKG